MLICSAVFKELKQKVKQTDNTALNGVDYLSNLSVYRKILALLLSLNFIEVFHNNNDDCYTNPYFFH